MNTLFFVRHAKASKSIPELKDIDRPLTERGYHDARKVARHLKKKNITVELMVTSPAVRAITTALIFAQELKYPYKDIAIDEGIYSDKKEDIISSLRKIKVQHKSVMVFGHNPSFEDLVNYLSSEKIERLNTTGVVSFETKGDSFEKGALQIKLHVSPRLLSK